MSCEITDKIKSILGEGGKPVSQSYALKMAALGTSLALLAAVDSDDPSFDPTVKMVKEVLHTHPQAMGDLQRLADHYLEFQVGLERYQQALEESLEDEVEGWDEENWEDEVEEEWDDLDDDDWDDDPSDEEWLELGIEKGEGIALSKVRKAFQAAFSTTFDNMALNDQLYGHFVRIAKSLATHLNPEKGDGEIRSYVPAMLASLAERVAELPQDNPLKAHYQAVLDDLKASLASAEGPKEGWKKPALVTKADLGKTGITVETLKALKVQAPEVWREYDGTDSDPANPSPYVQGLQQGFAHEVTAALASYHPAHQLDQTTAGKTIEVAKILAKQGMLESNQDLIEGSLNRVEKMVASLDDPTSEAYQTFESDADRQAFAAHYKAVVEGLRAFIEQGKKPERIVPFLFKALA